MEKPVSEAEVWLSRMNVVEARNNKLLQSWVPKSAQEAATSADDENSDDDFAGDSELAGLGTAAKASDSELDAMLKRRPLSTNDKLLEHLLGKQAAAKKRKEQQAEKALAKSNIAAHHGLSKPMNGQQNGLRSASTHPTPSTSQADESDDEMGRAAVFSSKSKSRDPKRPAYTTRASDSDAKINQDAEPPDPRDDGATVQEIVEGQQEQGHKASNEEEDERPRKKKATSYLDELLSKKKNKKGKGRA
jgi:hypothetical protein